jgi:hypothetical protein
MGMDWNAPHEAQEWYDWLHDTEDGRAMLNDTWDCYDGGREKAAKRRASGASGEPK